MGTAWFGIFLPVSVVSLVLHISLICDDLNVVVVKKNLKDEAFETISFLVPNVVGVSLEMNNVSTMRWRQNHWTEWKGKNAVSAGGRIIRTLRNYIVSIFKKFQIWCGQIPFTSRCRNFSLSSRTFWRTIWSCRCRNIRHIFTLFSPCSVIDIVKFQEWFDLNCRND